MLLSHEEQVQFFRLHRALMRFVNQRLRVIPENAATSLEFGALPAELRIKVCDAFLDHRDLIHPFVSENSELFPEVELNIVRSWLNLVAGKFYILRELKKYTVFLSTTDPAIAYGVHALSEPFENLIGPHLPVLTRTVLLPFGNKIVYHGLLASYPISFGRGIRRSLNEAYKDAKTLFGIVTSLPKSMVGQMATAIAANPISGLSRKQ